MSGYPAKPAPPAHCRECGKSFKRKHPSQRFCPPKGVKHVCKDRWHNRRRFASGALSDARIAFLSRNDPLSCDDPNIDGFYGRGWDDHKD